MGKRFIFPMLEIKSQLSKIVLKTPKYNYLFLLFVLLFSACSGTSTEDKRATEEVEAAPIFQQVHFTKSKISFINTLREDREHNFFNFNYIYNGAGAAVGDFDNDGLEDVYLVANQGGNKLFHNQGELTFADITETAGVAADGAWKNGVTVVDVNQDGWDDIYLVRSGRYEEASKRANQLFINNGDLTFTEAAQTYGLADTGYGMQAYFFDYDRDGDLDLYLMNHRMDFQNNNVMNVIAANEIFDPAASDRLYRNDNGRYVDVTAKAGLMNQAWGLSVVTGDFNNDGWDDIYVANDYLTPDLLYINQKDGTFKEDIGRFFPHTSFFSMGSDWADVDRNGHFDLFTLDMAPESHERSKRLMASMSNEYFRTMVNEGLQHQYMYNTLQYNHGEGYFSEIAQMAGIDKTDWSWTALFADYDNDGWKDLFVTNGIKKDITDNDAMNETERMRASGQQVTMGQVLRLLPSTNLQNPIFKNVDGLHFDRANTQWGMKQAFNSNGAVYADFDNDGDLEILVNNMGLMATLYQNLSVENHQQSAFKIEVKGPKRNLNALGTELVLHTNETKWVEKIRGSRGFLSHATTDIHYDADLTLTSVHVKWPNGKSSIIENPIKGDLFIDYEAMDFVELPKASKDPFFVSQELSGLSYTHKENEFDDFIKEILLPHRQSEHGPFIAIADVNNDGLEDVFVGGAHQQPAYLAIQQTDGSFRPSSTQVFAQDAAYEDMQATFFDADGDGDLDLYVVSGSGEFYEGNEHLLKDRLYWNEGNGQFKRAPTGTLPNDRAAGAKALPIDLDGDNDLDLIILNRNVPGKYPLGPKSFIYENQDGRFINVSGERNDDFTQLEAMLTDGVIADVSGNGYEDLLVVGEWTTPLLFLNDGTSFSLSDQDFSDFSGWWNRIVPVDLNGDGHLDFVLGNNGLNNKYHPTSKKPLYLFYNDFDNNGSGDIVLSKTNGEELVPVRGRECSSQQMPFILDKFDNYEKFAKADLVSIYSQEKLEASMKLMVNNFQSGLLMNRGDGSLEFKALPTKAQFGPINDILVQDLNGDGREDLICAGNFYGTEVETIRYDSHYGTVLINTGNFEFEVAPFTQTGLNLNQDVRDLESIRVNGEKYLISVANNDVLRSFRIRR